MRPRSSKRAQKRDCARQSLSFLRTNPKNLFPGLCEALVDLLPVDGIPPRGKIIRALVLVLQVISVLPDIIAQNRVMPLRERIVLIRSGDDLQLAAFINQPAPARAKLLRGGLVEGLLEG